MTPVRTNVTDPAPKYGPTPDYGSCEAAGCRSTARTDCVTCDGQFCLGHAGHTAHTAHAVNRPA